MEDADFKKAWAFIALIFPAILAKVFRAIRPHTLITKTIPFPFFDVVFFSMVVSASIFATPTAAKTAPAELEGLVTCGTGNQGLQYI